MEGLTWYRTGKDTKAELSLLDSAVINEVLEKIESYTDGEEICELVFQFLEFFGDFSPENPFWRSDICKITFEQHVYIFTALLKKRVKENKAFLRQAFYSYTTLMSYWLHSMRLEATKSESRGILDFFQKDTPPLVISSKKAFVACERKYLLALKQYLNARVVAFNEECNYWNCNGPPREKLKNSIELLIEEIEQGLRGRKTEGFSATQDNMFEVVHQLIRYRFQSYYQRMNRLKSREPLENGEPLLFLGVAYCSLALSVDSLSVLFRLYCRLIYEHTDITSDLQTDPAAQFEKLRSTQAGGYSNPCDRDVLLDNDSGRNQEWQGQDKASNLGDASALDDPVEYYDEDDMDYFDDSCQLRNGGNTHKGPSQSLPNRWGTRLRKWLESLIAQGRAMILLWCKRPKQDFVLEFPPLGGTSSDKMTPWLEQVKLKDNLASMASFIEEVQSWKYEGFVAPERVNASKLFKNITTIVENNEFVFNGTVHAELVVALKLNEWPKQSFCMGISRRPCYVCHKVLKRMAKACLSEAVFQPSLSSDKLWTVDVPKALPHKVIKGIWNEIMHDAGQCFYKYRHQIQSAVDEIRSHSIRSGSNPHSPTALEALDMTDDDEDKAEADEAEDMSDDEISQVEADEALGMPGDDEPQVEDDRKIWSDHLERQARMEANIEEIWRRILEDRESRTSDAMNMQDDKES